MKTEFRTTSVPLRSDDTNLMIAAIQIGLRRDCLLHPRNLSLMIGRSSNQDDCYQAERCLRLADVTGSIRCITDVQPPCFGHLRQHTPA